MSANPKELLFHDEARAKLFEGIRTLGELVRLTLGPKGRNVGLQSWKTPEITNDGNQISSEIELKDPFANMGVSLAREVVSKVKEKCGDGSTTGIVLLQALVEEGLKSISVGHNSIMMKNGMEKALQAILAHLEKNAFSVKNPSDTKNIASVSASGNQQVGQMIEEAFQKVGKEGAILIEEAKGCETILEIVEGMEIDRGYLSAYFCTNQEKMITEMNHPLILLTDKKISSIQEILPLLQSTASLGKELLIVADDMENDLLATLVINKLKGILKVAAIKAPSFGDQRKALMEDLAVLTGATFIAEEKGLSLEKVSPEMLGSCEKVMISKEKTSIVQGKGTKKAIQNRVHELEAECKKCTSHEKATLEKRKAKLQGGLAIIRVGAHTEVEMKGLKQLFEDSLHSTRAALEEGIVIGGGLALLRAKGALQKLSLSSDEKLGADILFRALSAPAKQILENAGLESSLILDALLNDKPLMGYNVMNDQVEDFLKCGIVDPLKVVKTSLLHAVSIATLVLTSEVVLSDAEEPK